VTAGSIAWGRRELDADVWSLCLDRTRRAFESFDHVLVSFSGGKDSTVVLNAALMVAEEVGRLPVRTVFYDEEAIPYETEDFVRRVAADERVALEWYCVPIQHRNACSRDEPYWWPWAPEAEALWTRPLPPEAITTLPGFQLWPADDRPTMPHSTALLAPASRYGTVGVLMGIRADESLTRRAAVGNLRTENWVIAEDDVAVNYRKVYPIYDMTTPDVWTAPARFGWDHNQTYDLMEMAGVAQKDQRCGPAYGEQPLRRLWTFKLCFPDVWEPMTRRVPGAACAARYSNTELYSMGAVKEKPDGISWQEWIRRRLAEYDDDQVRRYVANRIQATIRTHYRKTAEPILSAAHPYTGVSWLLLYRMADRGDLKSRIWPDYHADPERYEAAWATEQPDTFPGFTT
jgi:predicted phosphoadenosine phosphosulfate sulfurtransferase